MAHARDKHRKHDRPSSHRQAGGVARGGFLHAQERQNSNGDRLFRHGRGPAPDRARRIVQPSQIGPFKFGVSTMVQTGKTGGPGAFSITQLEARDDQSVPKVREGSGASMADLLKMNGFIGATTATIGLRMVTISAWESPEASRRVMTEGAHATVMKGLYDGSLANHGYTSVWCLDQAQNQPGDGALRILRQNESCSPRKAGMFVRCQIARCGPPSGELEAPRCLMRLPLNQREKSQWRSEKYRSRHGRIERHGLRNNQGDGAGGRYRSSVAGPQ
jgi:hypothetical protein